MCYGLKGKKGKAGILGSHLQFSRSVALGEALDVSALCAHTEVMSTSKCWCEDPLRMLCNCEELDVRYSVKRQCIITLKTSGFEVIQTWVEFQLCHYLHM